jgi:hypothetical protein
MNPNWKKKMNAIPVQRKGPSDRITAQEWNQIINILSEQVNNNTLGNEKFIKIVEEIESGNLKKELVFKIFKNYEGDLSKFIEDLIMRMELIVNVKRYETEDDFPEVGDEESLYIAKFYKSSDEEGNIVLNKLNSIFGFDPESGYYEIDGQKGGALEFHSEFDFPLQGKENFLYLAKNRNTALEGEEPVWEKYNMLFRWDAEQGIYEAVAGQGSGGGGSGTGTVTRVIPFPVGIPTVFGHNLLEDLILGYSYINNTYDSATRILYVNDIPKNTAQISTGENSIDVTPYLTQGLNTIKIYITDPEGTASQLIYRVTGNTMSLSSLFNDATAIIGTDVFVPYSIVGTAQVKTMHFILDEVETTEVVSNLNGNKIISGLNHGVHKLEIFVVGDFKDNNGNTLYSITSNSVFLDIIYAQPGETETLISSKFRLQEEYQGNTIFIDYIVYNPILELSEVSLYIDDVLFTTLSVDDTRQTWSIKTLQPGMRTLKIESNGVYVEKTINILPIELDLDVTKDSFLKLFLTAFGKTNNDLDKDVWVNSFGNSVNVTLQNINFSNTGWVSDSLRLIGDAKAIIGFKPFGSNLASSGKTIEFDFTTRFTVSENTKLISCMSGGVGFEITTQSVSLKGSNIEILSRFKEDEHIKIAFVIRPTDKMILTYINGVISGVANYTNETSFRQLVPVDITVNPEGGALDLYSIRVYDRALNNIEMLENYLAEISTLDERVEKFMFNDIFDEYGNASKDKMSQLIPIMMFDAPIMPQFKGDKRPLKVTFEHPFDPSKNFIREADKTVVDWQGTSSIQYPVKNFKITFDKKQKYPIEDGWIPERKFTLKADYMDSSHSHNTGFARLFDTMYDEGLPPKQYDERIRSTVYGYPIALFYRPNANSPYEYWGVYNFNLDKDCEDTFGLNNEKNYVDAELDGIEPTFPLCQSFEITFNADSSAGAFKNNELMNVVASFEARYPELDGDTVYNVDTGEVHDAVALEAHYANLRAMIQWVMDNDNNPNFKTEFDLHFNRDYTLKYLIATELFGLVDNLGKNAMMNTWDGQIWYPNFYDVDTAMGLENQGRNIHNYDIEIGQVGTYATADSGLWINIMRFFYNELQAIYQNLRGDKFSYNKVLEFLETNQISKISESQYNLDAYAKYIGVTTDWLWMAQGKRIEHIKRWLTLRMAFLDSKYIGGEFANYVALRINVTGDDLDPAYLKAKVTITPIITQYATAKFGNTNPVQQKTPGNTPVEIVGPSVIGNSGITNMEVSVYGAKYIEDLGDLSTLYLSSISTEFAQRLRKLLIGSQAEGYINDKLTQVSVGNNSYLEEIDLTNCTILGTDTNGTQVLDLSQAVNIKKVHAHGTQLKGITFPSGANLELLKLPASITQLVLRNMPLLTAEGLLLDGINNITLLRIENINGINSVQLANLAASLQRLRLIGLKYSMLGMADMISLAEKLWDSDLNSYRIIGVDATGQDVNEPIVEGIIKVLTYDLIANEDIVLIQSRMPNLQLEVNQITEGMTFEDYEDGLRMTGYTGIATILSVPGNTNAELSEENPIIPSIDGWKPVIAIAPFALNNKTAITQVIIPRTVEAIGQQAFNGMTNLGITYIPNTVETMGLEVFRNTPNALILCEAPSKPEGWNNNWYASQALTILWGVPSANSTFNFNSNGGSSVDQVINNVLFQAPTAPTRLGKDFVKWQYNGQDVTFPFVPEVAGEYTFTAVWEDAIFTVQYLKPDGLGGWVLHDSHFIQYGDFLGSEFQEISIPISGTLSFREWRMYSPSGELVFEGTQILHNHITSPDGNIIKIYAIMVDTAGLGAVFLNDDVANYPDGYYNIVSYVNNNSGNAITDLLIPSQWTGIEGTRPVKGVRLTSGSFINGNLYKVRTLTIEEGVKRIEQYAFNGISYCTKVTVPASVVFIGSNAFNGAGNNIPSVGCELIFNCNLDNITGPYIASNARVKINIAFGTTKINNSLFYNSMSIKEIILPNSVLELKANCFGFGVTGESPDLSFLPDSVWKIEDGAFQGWLGLTDVIIPRTVTSYSWLAFSRARNLGTITIYKETNIIPNTNSTGWSEALTAPLFDIDADHPLFQGTPNKKCVYEKTGSKRIIYLKGDGDVVMPDDAGNFYSSSSSLVRGTADQISSLYINEAGSIPSMSHFITASFISVHVNNASLSSDEYGNLYNKTKTNLIRMIKTNPLSTLHPNVTTWNNSQAFALYEGETNFVVPSRITSISGSEMFSKAKIITLSFEEGSTITSLPAHFARECKQLTTVVLPNTITSIESNCFSTTPALQNINLHEGITKIDSDAFEMSGLTSITIPSTVTTIGSDAFHDCSSLAEIIVLRTTPPTIGDGDALDGHVPGRAIKVPVGKVSTYQAATHWSEYASNIVENV